MTETANQTAQPNLVKITDKAIAEILKLYEAAKAEKPDLQGLRLGVKGGGCSGMSYNLEFGQKQGNDYEIETPINVPVFIDPKSAIYLKGIILDFQGGLEGKGFVFVNPNATSTCGCGESFSV